ncbi:MAG: hypothetical protein DWQ02_25255 [Bacteroidetes bacterium]|nr:MAG: hypothetical protein DWQ02_25255 [Bacteroidota bacterium]
MKLVKRALLFFSLLLATSVIIQSCCETNITIVGNGSMFISQNDNNRQDTIRSEFRIVLYLEMDYANNLGGSGIISSAYATQCMEFLVNTMNRESLKLTCDRDFLFEGMVIEAGTDFLNEEIMPVLFHDEGGEIYIFLNNEYLNSAQFETGDHEFSIEIETSDGAVFTNQQSAWLELN